MQTSRDRDSWFIQRTVCHYGGKYLPFSASAAVKFLAYISILVPLYKVCDFNCWVAVFPCELSFVTSLEVMYVTVKCFSL